MVPILFPTPDVSVSAKKIFPVFPVAEKIVSPLLPLVVPTIKSSAEVLAVKSVLTILTCPVAVTAPPSATENTSVDPSYKFKISPLPL